MKLLWITNVEIPLVSEAMGKNVTVFGGWLDYISRQVAKENDITFVSCGQKDIEKDFLGFSYASFTKKDNYKRFVFLFTKYQPDIIHLYGTELSHTPLVIQALKETQLLGHLLISIQGLSYFISEHYLNDLPHRICKRYGIRELILRRNIYGEQRLFQRRGCDEVNAIKEASFIEGRTEYDYKVTKLINPQEQYFICNETLRDSFYHATWDIRKIKRHSIFVSQCSYSVKGFHRVIEALNYLVKFYPDVHVYTTGSDLFHPKDVKEWAMIGSYRRYLKELLIKNHFEDRVTFLGILNAQKMCEQLLLANVYVSPSSIENSPNSMGEAMLVGCPVVASRVGGVDSLLENKKEGLLYQADAPYLMAYDIMEIFNDDELAQNFSKNAQKRAKETHDRDTIVKTQLEIYKRISKKQETNSNFMEKSRY